MRLLHTSDWHLGRSFHGAPLLEHQVAAIEAMVGTVRSERIDVVLIAGDIYDRQLPPVDAVSALSHALCELRGAGARVIAISGNHDSATRLGFLEPVLSLAGVTIRGDVATAGTPIVVPATDGGPDLAVYPIPYLEPELARHRLDVDARTHDALLRHALDRARADRAARGRVRAVAVAHAFVAGGSPCESERVLTVGGSSEVGLAAFDGFDYVALGHLHGRQEFGEGRVRYSGSPLAYSFSEQAHVKGAWIIEVSVTGALAVEGVELPVPRPLAVIRGTLAQLLESAEHTAAEHAWVQAILTEPVLPPEAMSRLRRRFPHALCLKHEPAMLARGTQSDSYSERVRDRSDLDLSLDFIDHVTGAPATEEERSDLVAALSVSIAGGAAGQTP